MKKLGFLATVIAAIAFSVAPAFADAIELKRDNIGIGGTDIDWSTSFVAEVNSVDEVVIVPLNWVVDPAGLDEVFGMFVRVERRRVRKKNDQEWELDLGGVSAVGAQLLSGGRAALCPGSPPVGDCFFVNVPVIWKETQCGGGGAGKGKAAMKLRLEVLPSGVEVGFGFSLKVRDPNGNLCK